MRLSKFILLMFVIMLGGMLPSRGSVPYVDSTQNIKNTELEEVVVSKKKKAKYSKKNNPAVELLNRIREKAPKGDPRNTEAYGFDKYEKVVISLNDFNRDKYQWLSKRLSPIEDFIDTAHITGKEVLNVSVRELKARELYKGSSSARKELILGRRNSGIDESFNQENIQIMLDDVFREIDVYSNDITILQNRFVSPLSRIGSDYYKYFLGDTIDVSGRKCVELIFVPHNPESFSFNGSLYVDVEDSTCFIPKLSMRVPKALNLNFVSNIFVEQEYEQDFAGNRNKKSDRMSVELQLVPGVQGFYVSRDAFYDKFSYFPDEMDLGGKQVERLSSEVWRLRNFDSRDESFWESSRSVSASKSERSVSNLASRMDQIPALYWARKAINLLVTGYIPTWRPSKVDIGPVNTFLSFNSVEGTRLRLGGMTTGALSPYIFLRGYGAYGFKDHRWKYGAEVDFSLRRKKNHSREFPMHNIRLEHSYDLDMIGQHYLFTNADNIFLSLKRKSNDLVSYRRMSRVSWNYETVGGLSISAGYKYVTQESTPWVTFEDGMGNKWDNYKIGAFFIDVIYAPGAKFVQTANNRYPVNMDNWTLRLTHEIGPKKWLGSDFMVNKTDVSVAKRFWFSSFGYLDALVKGSWVWSSVPYPMLPWANANLSYTIQPESFALMNPMEFATDRSCEWFFTYWMNGLLMNRIPFIKELKLREVITFSGLFGRLSARNNPKQMTSLFAFPESANIKPMSGKPYMEIGVGLDNILKVLRVDYIWRLTHRNTPDAPNHGLRVSLHFSF